MAYNQICHASTYVAPRNYHCLLLFGVKILDACSNVASWDDYKYVAAVATELPASLDHILAFIYLAYSMMALFYETVQMSESCGWDLSVIWTPH